MTLSTDIFPDCLHVLNGSYVCKRNPGNILKLTIHQHRILCHMFKLQFSLGSRIVLRICNIVFRHKCVKISHWIYFHYVPQNLSWMYILFSTIFTFIVRSHLQSQEIMVWRLHSNIIWIIRCALYGQLKTENDNCKTDV